jgi:hypothetical protein
VIFFDKEECERGLQTLRFLLASVLSTPPNSEISKDC